MKNKKAFEIQFNWMFILIIGASILIFFTAIAIKQKGISEASIDITILKSLQSIVSSTSISTGTTQIKDIQASNIEFDCNKISVGRSSKQYENLILFAPNLIKDEELITKTSVFSLPYKVTNFLYITSPKVKYMIISNGNDFAKQVNESMPTELNNEFYETVEDIPSLEGISKVRFIFFDSTDETVLASRDMFDYDVTALKISGNGESGVVEYYEKNGNRWESKGSSYYIGLSSLIGSIYSDKIENYECNMKNSFKTLNLVTQVYIARTSELFEASVREGDIQCNRIYDAANNDLETIEQSSNFDETSIDTLKGISSQLLIKNQEAQSNSCSLIY